jgi:hypothetical protein
MYARRTDYVRKKIMYARRSRIMYVAKQEDSGSIQEGWIMYK